MSGLVSVRQKCLKIGLHFFCILSHKTESCLKTVKNVNWLQGAVSECPGALVPGLQNEMIYLSSFSLSYI